MKTPAPADLHRWSEELARNPGSLAFLPLARAYRRLGRRDLALQLCLRGLEHHPTHVEAHALLALLHFEAGERARAADEWATVLRLKPGNFEALRGMGFRYLEQGDIARARQHLERAALIRPDDGTVQEALRLIRHQETAMARPSTRPGSAPPTAQSIPQRTAEAPRPAPAGQRPSAARPPAPPPSAGKPAATGSPPARPLAAANRPGAPATAAQAHRSPVLQPQKAAARPAQPPRGPPASAPGGSAPRGRVHDELPLTIELTEAMATSPAPTPPSGGARTPVPRTPPPAPRFEAAPEPAMPSAHPAMPTPHPPAPPPDPTTVFDSMTTGPLLGVLLLDLRGLVLAGWLRSGGHGKAEELGAVLGGAIDEALRTVTHLSLGGWRGLLLECETAVLHVAPVGKEALVVVAAQRGAPAGWILRSAAHAASLAERFVEVMA